MGSEGPDGKYSYSKRNYIKTALYWLKRTTKVMGIHDIIQLKESIHHGVCDARAKDLPLDI